MPAIPNTAVKMLSMNTLAKLLRGPAQPLISEAAAGDGHVGSVTKAGELLLKKPQQANYCRILVNSTAQWLIILGRGFLRTVVCIKSWTFGGCAFHNGDNVSFVRSVRIQRYRPKMTEKTALTTSIYPESLSQPRVGMAIAGSVNANVTNTNTPLTMPAARR